MSYEFPLDKLREIWESSPLVVIDTNVFLNLYRYSSETTNDVLDILDKVPQENFWLPAQVIKEYETNSKSVIFKEHNKYKEVTEEVDRIMLNTKNAVDKQFRKFAKFKFPKVNDFEKKIHLAIESVTEKSKNYKEEIKEEVEKNKKMLKDDKVKDFIDELTNNGRIGKPFNVTELLQIYSEGEQRYQYKIPPGYMDIEKDKKDKTKRKKFGDLILWKQLLEKSKNTNKAIIFITNDEKEDWWVLDQKSGAPLNPHKELFDEFKEYSDYPLAIMNLTNFINHFSIINEKINPTTYLEMNAEDITKKLIEQKSWEEIINIENDLTQYLIHGDDLQTFLPNAIENVEIMEYFSPEIEIESFEFDDNRVFIEFFFYIHVELSITEFIFQDYTKDIIAPDVIISGHINFEFDVDFEKDKDFIIMDTLEIGASGFDVIECNLLEEEYEDICISCGDPDVSYYTSEGNSVCRECISHFETCPGCGKLFEEGTLNGAFCRPCELKK